MMEKKLFKTKLCVLYQRGRCSRQSCSFAHGDAELRSFSESANEKTYMEEKIREAGSLASRHEELETQLRKEQELCKRITSKMKKFIKVHSRYSKAQEELKRSQARLQRFGDQLASDFPIQNANEEDSSINIVSDGEPNHNNAISQGIELQNHASPSKKRAWISLGIGEEAKPGNFEKDLVATTRVEKLIRGNGTSTQSDHNYKEADELNKIMFGSNGHRSLAMFEDKNKRRKNGPSVPFAEKVKGLESSHVLPSTSMAAHAVDEFIDVIETEEKIEVVEAANGVTTGAQEEKTMFPYLPPPPPFPPPKNAYKLYEGDDQDVDVTEMDGETRDVDATSEVDIL